MTENGAIRWMEPVDPTPIAEAHEAIMRTLLEACRSEHIPTGDVPGATSSARTQAKEEYDRWLRTIKGEPGR